MKLNIASLAVALFSAASVLFSCKGPGTAEPSTEFSTYISAYTGGVVTGASTIRVELASDVIAPEGQLFSFNPSLKGETRWISPSVVEFIPEEGELKAGTLYKAAFDLASVADVKDTALKKFEFSFRVAPKTVSLKCDNVRITSDEPDLACVSGTVSFSEAVAEDAVAGLITASYGRASYVVELHASGDGKTFSFTVPGLAREDRQTRLELSLNASKLGYKGVREAYANIPAKGNFRLEDAALHEGADPFVELTFSEALDESDAEDGFISLEGVGRSYVQIDANRARIFFDALPSSGSVTLKVSSMTAAYDKSRLGSDFTRQFSSSAVKPAVRFSFSGNILPDASQLTLPFQAIGLRSVNISVIKIYKSNVLMYLQDNDLGESSGLRRSGRLVCSTEVRLDGDPDKPVDKWQNYSVDLSDLFKKEAGALYRIKISFDRESSIYGSLTDASPLVSLRDNGLTEEEKDVWDSPSPYWYDDDNYDWREYEWEDRDNPAKPTYYMQSSRFPNCVLLSSNIGIIAKSADSDRLWVTVTDILSAKPLSGAEVTAYNYQLQEIGKSKSDADGFADFKTSGKPFALVVKDGKSVGYLKVTDGEEKSLSRFDTGGQALSSGLKGFVYGERGVWRPGDTLHVSLMVEDRDRIIPESHPVTMELYNPQGQFYARQVNASGVKGLYVFNIPTSSSDPTGTWNAYFKLGGATFHKSLPVETVKANRLKVALDVNAPMLQSDVAAAMTLTSSWLTGPAASGLKSVVEMTLSRAGAGFKGYEDYSFSDPVSEFTHTTCTLFEKNLDSSGKASASIVMPKAQTAPGMLKANIVTRVMEPGGDASVSTQTMKFAPFGAFVGVKLPPDSSEALETDKDLAFPVVLLSPEGTKVLGHKLEYKIFKLDWSWWWESGGEYLDSYVNGSSATPVREGSFTSGSGEMKINFRVDYPEWGRYLVYVKDLTGGHAAGGIVYVDWPAWRGRSDKSDPSALSMLAFSTDKKSCEAGEEVSVYIPAAADGRALVSLENGRGVISHEWVKTSAEGETKHTIMVTPEMAPNFYVHISLLQSHRHSDNDLPIRMYGVQPVSVTDRNSHLKPVLTLPEVIRPQEEFAVKVREESGKPMSYTLAVVDEGLLDITSFKTPDPWGAMYAREALGVKTWDMFDEVIGAYSGKFSPLMSIGGDENIDPSQRKDNRFNPVVRFYGPFTLEKGTATHKITLPMYVGSVRVMVVAGRDGAYGSAEKAVPVRSPLMILPTLPRVLGTGEKVVLPVNVFAMEDNVRKVNVSVNVEGPARVTSAPSTSLSFAGNGDKLAGFTLETGDGEGVVKVKVTAESGSYKAEETVSVEVRNPSAPVVSSESLYLKGGQSGKFSFEPFKTGDNAWAKLRMSNFPAVDFDGLFSFAETYPYDCTEQLSSKGLTMVYVKQFLGEDNAAKADDMIKATLQLIYGRQLPDGGFAYWPGNAVADEWATSMAGQFLTEAAAMGYPVNKGVLSSWKKFQKKASSNYKHSDKYRCYDLQQAYRLYCLALAGDADEGAMNRLKAAPEMTNQARWRLAAAYAVNGKKNVARQIVEKLDTEIVDKDSNRYTYGSDSRDKALMLETAVLIDELPLAMSLSEDVADGFRDCPGTESSAFAALAMSRLAGKVGDAAIDVSVAGNEVKSAKSSHSISADPSAGEVEVRNLSKDPVYLTFLSRRPASVGAVVPASASNITLSVRYTDMAGRALSPERLSQGQDFKAVVTVVNAGASSEPVANLALTEVFPSGWEIFNDRLFDAASAEDGGYAYKDIRDDRVIWYFDLPAGGRRIFETRLQAAYAGDFVLPAVTCEAMYDNETHANSASGRALVEQ